MIRTAVAGIAAACLLVAGLLGCSDPAPPAAAPVAAAAAQGDGAEVLRRVVAAEKSLVYTGYKRTIHGEEGEGRATRMQVARYPNGKTLLTWDQPAGSRRRWVYKSRFAWLDDPDLLLRNYTVTLDPADGPAVAWRESRHLRITSVRPGRPSVELLVDKETHLVLREEVRDFEGRLWLTNVFDTIEYRAPDEPLAEASAEVLDEPVPARGPGSALPLGVTRAPTGFVRVGWGTADGGGQREDWSDGLAAFSVLERPAAGPRGAGTVGDPAEGELQRRTCHGRASVSGVLAGIEVSVVGNLSASELESVVRGLAPAK